MRCLESVEVQSAAHDAPFRMPVQYVNRPNLDFRGFSGQIVGGPVQPGDRIRVLPSGSQSTVKSIVTYGGDLEHAVEGLSITLTLNNEIDVSRGDVIAAAEDPPSAGDPVRAHVV